MSANKKRSAPLVILLVLSSLVISACQSASANDLLGEIKSRGTLRISTDVNYAPQSSSVQGAQRPANTKCDAAELTAAEVEGFDIDTAVEIAKRLGVEAVFRHSFVGLDHRRQLGRPLGCERWLDDHHAGSREGPVV